MHHETTLAPTPATSVFSGAVCPGADAETTRNVTRSSELSSAWAAWAVFQLASEDA